MKKWLLLIGLYASISTAGEMVPIEILCDDTKIISEELRDKYNEIPVVMGKTNDVAGTIMTLWTNPISNTWTIVATKNETSCIVGTGEKLRVIDYKKKRI